MNSKMKNLSHVDMYRFILVISLMVLSLVSCKHQVSPGAYSGSDVHKSKPNVVLINVDDLGYGDIGCYGATYVKTPNINRLAGQGCRFTDFHSASAVCSPSRYALITGEYPIMLL